ALIRDLRAKFRTGSPAADPGPALQLAEAARWLVPAGAPAEAEPLLRDSLAVLEKRMPEDWRTFSALSALGGSLLGQKKYAEAERLLLKGDEGMKAREQMVLPAETRLPEALDRLIELYTATNKPDEVKKWRAERAKYPKIAPPTREKK